MRRSQQRKRRNPLVYVVPEVSQEEHYRMYADQMAVEDMADYYGIEIMCWDGDDSYLSEEMQHQYRKDTLLATVLIRSKEPFPEDLVDRLLMVKTLRERANRSNPIRRRSYVNFYFSKLLYDENSFVGEFLAPAAEIYCEFAYDRNSGQCEIWNNSVPVEEILPLPIWWLDLKLRERGSLNESESRVCFIEWREKEMNLEMERKLAENLLWSKARDCYGVDIDAVRYRMSPIFGGCFDGSRDEVDGFIFKNDEELADYRRDANELIDLLLAEQEIPKDLEGRLMRIKELREKKMTDYLVCDRRGKNIVSNRITFTSASNRSFDFILRGNLIVIQNCPDEVREDFISSLKRIGEDGGDIGAEIDRVELIYGSLCNAKKVKKHFEKSKGKLFVVDDSTRFITEDLALAMGFQYYNNQYIVFTSTDELSFDRSPNYYPDVVKVEGVYKLRYQYWVLGWR